MFTRRQRKAPKVPKRVGIDLLVDRAEVELRATGKCLGPAAPWLAAACVLLSVRHSCGWDMDTTPQQIIEQHLTGQGWVHRWEDDHLVLELPGWAAPAPRIVAVQPGLFDSFTGE